MHTHLILALLLPLALADQMTQIGDGQIQEHAGPALVPAPKLATSTSTFTPSPAPTAAAIKEAGAVAAPPKANVSVPAPAKFESAAPILIAPAAVPNATIPSHHAYYEAPQPSASVGRILPVENGTAPTVPTLPPIMGQAPTSLEGSPKEAGVTQVVSKGRAGRLRVVVSVWVGVLGVVGLAAVLG